MSIFFYVFISFVGQFPPSPSIRSCIYASLFSTPTQPLQWLTHMVLMIFLFLFPLLLSMYVSFSLSTLPYLSLSLLNKNLSLKLSRMTIYIAPLVYFLCDEAGLFIYPLVLLVVVFKALSSFVVSSHELSTQNGRFNLWLLRCIC